MNGWIFDNMDGHPDRTSVRIYVTWDMSHSSTSLIRNRVGGLWEMPPLTAPCAAPWKTRQMWLGSDSGEKWDLNSPVGPLPARFLPICPFPDEYKKQEVRWCLGTLRMLLALLNLDSFIGNVLICVSVTSFRASH